MTLCFQLPTKTLIDIRIIGYYGALSHYFVDPRKHYYQTKNFSFIFILPVSLLKTESRNLQKSCWTAVLNTRLLKQKLIIY